MKFPSSTITLLAVGLIGAGCMAAAAYLSEPRVLAVEEVPLAFWAWKNQAPATADVQNAFSVTRAKTLFLRAGQFDTGNGSLERIRAVGGQLPADVEIHLVYNGTRRFLGDWERLGPENIVRTINETYLADLKRARDDGANVTGIQLDLDVPERLLPQYALVIGHLRNLLPPATKLSITGLPTWMGTKDISLVLAVVDFWIPQFYGARIAMNSAERVPVSSTSEVEQNVIRARRLNKPFYAGLSAYGSAILYDRNGQILELRGDIDPASAERHKELSLVDTRSFKADQASSEMRYVYRANADVVLDGLVIKPGETIVFDQPNAGSLRAAAKSVRENAGEKLLGICVFRLPSADDRTNLSVSEIAAALGDKEATPKISVSLRSGTRAPLPVSTEAGKSTRVTADADVQPDLILTAKNTGSAATVIADDAVTVDLAVPAGAISDVKLAGFASYETMCALGPTNEPRPCSSLRGNVIRLKANSWRPGDEASAVLKFKDQLPPALSAVAVMHSSDGRIERQTFELSIDKQVL